MAECNQTHTRLARTPAAGKASEKAQVNHAENSELSRFIFPPAEEPVPNDPSQEMNDQLGSLDSQIQSLLRQAAQFQDPALKDAYWEQAMKLAEEADKLEQRIIEGGGTPR